MCCEGKLGVPFESQRGFRALSPSRGGTLCPFNLWPESRFLSAAIGETSLLLRTEGNVGIPLESEAGESVSSQMKYGT